MSDDPEDAPVFKKPSRKANIRKRERAEEAAEDGPSVGATTSSLEVMRELQRQRQRAKGVNLDPTTNNTAEEAVVEAADEGVSATQGLEVAFTSQADTGDIDQNMLNYIEEQMQGGSQQADAGAQGGGVLDAEEAELYTTPAHLLGNFTSNEPDAAENSANRWLAGIMEVPLSTSDKIASIEQTEAAKRKMMVQQHERHASHAAEQAREGHKMVVPANYNSNFHQHRRENAISKKAQMGGSKPQDGNSSSMKGTASDSAAFSRFRNYERGKKR